jgi:glucose/arabinose dehydrogenase
MMAVTSIRARALLALTGLLLGVDAGARDIALEPVVTSGLDDVVYVTHARDGSGRLFVLEQEGRIRIIAGGKLEKEPFLNIIHRVGSGGERGLLGLAFHPRYATNGRYFVNYTRNTDGATVVAEYRVSRNPDRSDDVERVLLVIPQPYRNHNGGMIEFGLDGFLYVATGDGGSGGDPGNRAQNRRDLLGKMLRIDVDGGEPYGIPANNPFASGGALPEIYAIGLRNPWRFSFDRQSGDLWVGDVGQNAWEEIHVIESGGNYGWRIMEGNHCYQPRTGCNREGLVLPVAEYAQEQGRCSITGGYVYRGSAVPALVGTYVYGDFCSGEIFGLRDGKQRVLLSTGLAIASFGEDGAGELFVVEHDGEIHRITAAGN